MSFVATIQKLVANTGPWFIKSRNIAKFRQAFAMAYDSAINSLQQGVALSQPFRCDASALPVLSIDRSIRLYPSEPEASQRLRLAKWFILHRTRGTHIGELLHSQPYFLPDTPIMRIVHQDGAGASATWWTIDASGDVTEHVQTPSNWRYDGLNTKWSRFWVILYVPASLLTTTTYDDGSLYDGGQLYNGLTLAQVAKDIKDMILEWKSGHSRLQAYILATDPASFDPTSTAVADPAGWTSMPVGNWGSSMSPPPVSVKTRPPTAFWIYECPSVG